MDPATQQLLVDAASEMPSDLVFLMTSKPKRYRKFWARYLQQTQAEHPEWVGIGTASGRNYLYQSSPIRDCRIGPCFKRDARAGHELVIMSMDPARNADPFRTFQHHRVLLEETYGRRLIWDEVSGAKRYLIGDYRYGSIERDAENDEYILWFIDCGERLRAALGVMPTDL
jgi:hypothetical protein